LPMFKEYFFNKKRMYNLVNKILNKIFGGAGGGGKGKGGTD